MIEEAQQITLKTMQATFPDAYWTIYYSDIINRLNSEEQLKAFGQLNTTYTWVLQLLMALECDTFVGTRGSNWNRLIDELRCVWVGKCFSPYMEMGPLKDWPECSWR